MLNGFRTVNKLFETANNEIKDFNFISQTKGTDILVPNQRSKIGKMSKICKINKKILDMHSVVLYNYLVKKKIIKKERKKVSLFTWEDVYTIDKKLIDAKKLKKLLDKNNNDYPYSLECYNVNYKKLHSFLENYKYDSLDREKLAVNLLHELHAGKKNKKVDRTAKQHETKRLNYTKKKRNY